MGTLDRLARIAVLACLCCQLAAGPLQTTARAGQDIRVDDSEAITADTAERSASTSGRPHALPESTRQFTLAQSAPQTGALTRPSLSRSPFHPNAESRLSVHDPTRHGWVQFSPLATALRI